MTSKEKQALQNVTAEEIIIRLKEDKKQNSECDYEIVRSEDIDDRL